MLKKQLVTTTGSFVIWGVLSALWILLSSCSGGIQGKVYFDENDNGMFDLGERGVPSAKVTVYKEGESSPVASGFTKPDGSFALSTRGGTYYFSVDVSSLGRAAITPSGKGEEEEGRSDEKAFTWPSTDDAEGDTSSSNPPTSTGAGSQGSTQGSGPASDDANSNQTSKGKTVPPDQWTDRGYRVHVPRQETKSATIGIRIDWDGAAPSERDAVEKKVCYAGQRCEISIRTISGCRTMVGLFPEARMDTSPETPNRGYRYSRDLNVVTISDPQTLRVKAQEKGGAAINSVRPAAVTKRLPLIISNDARPRTGVSEPTTATLKPRALCGEREISLGSVEISLLRDVAPRITLDWDPQQKERVSVTILNVGKSRLDDAEVVFNLESAEFATRDNEIKNLGQSALWVTGGLAAGEERTKKLELDLPPPSDDDILIKVEATLRSPQLAEAIEAVPIKFTIKKKI